MLSTLVQEVHLDKDVKLLDCPGVVMLSSGANDASIALRNCKRIEKLDDPVAPVKEILKLCPAALLVTLYKLPRFDSVDDFLQKVATVRGKLKKGGIVDVEAAARIILHDWNEGKIPFYTMPPIRNQGEPSEAKIVSELGKEFNIDEVYNNESSFIGSLKSIDDLNPVEVPPSRPLNFDEIFMDLNDEEPKPSTQGDEDPKGIADDGGDVSMASEEDGAEKNKGKTATSKQNEKLYAVEGMLNTKLKRAEKKRRKKADKLNSEDAMDDDYDFKVDYANKGSSMDAGDQIIGEVPMSGIELDDE